MKTTTGSQTVSDHVRRILLIARGIVEDGGDPDTLTGCDLGPYCLRCCLGEAYTMMDVRPRSDLPTEIRDVLTGTLTDLPADAPLNAARERLRECGDLGVAHTRESALAMLDKMESNT